MNRYQLYELSYPYDALEPYLDAQTLEIHHAKHHQGYVNKLNDVLEPYPQLQGKQIEELLKYLDTVPEEIRTKVRNFGGGHANHALFWSVMKKNGGGKPQAKIGEEITRQFESFDVFKEQFSSAATTLFGSGWAWLILNPSGILEIVTTPNQDTPLSYGAVPLLVLDVWEHAYYLKYKNRRADFIAAWWHVINWEQVNAYFKTAHG